MVTLTKNEAAQVAAMAQVTSKDSARPALGYVNLRKTDKALEVWATDSIRLALLSISTPDEDSSFGVVAVDAEALAKVLKTSSLVSLEVVDGRDAQALKVTQAGGGTYELPAHLGGISHESAARLISDALNLGGCVSSLFDADKLGSLCRVVKSAYGKNARVSIYTHGMSAAYLYATDMKGSTLEMLLMPCRR